jgi:steroid Delta-isomerase
MVPDRMEGHFSQFNEAVRTGNWTFFLATFAPDAVMRFENVPAGPFEGIGAISAAYAENPPDDTMTMVFDERHGDGDVVRFAWDAGGTGTMRVTWRDGLVSDLTVAFD